MSVNFDKHSVEKRHDKRFLGIFLMFVVIAVVVGLFSAVSIAAISGYGIFDIFKASTSAPVIGGSSSGGSGGLVAFWNGTNGTNGTVINCTDTDGGIEPYIFGIVRFGGKTYSDFCWKNGNQTNLSNATNVLAEFYCWDNKARRTLMYCPSGCSGGVCLNVTINDSSPGAGMDGINPNRRWCDNAQYMHTYASQNDCFDNCFFDAAGYCNSLCPGCTSGEGSQCEGAGGRQCFYQCRYFDGDTTKNY